MAYTLQTAQQLTGVTSSLLGTGLQIYGAIQSRKASRGILDAARTEAIAAIEKGDVIAQTAIQNAYASLFDIASVDEQRDANIAFLRRQGHSLESTIAARVAASGVELTGSPLLVMGKATLETARAIANEELTAKTGTRQLKFQAEQDLLAAQQSRIAAQREVKAIRKGAKKESHLLRQQSTSQFIEAGRSFSNTVNSPAVQSLLKGEG